MAPAVFPKSFTIIMIMIICNNLSDKCLSTSTKRCDPMYPKDELPVYPHDIDPVQFALNLEFLEADYFLFGALGYGLDEVAPELAKGGPPPIGAQKANLDDLTQSIITEFGYQEVGHIRAILSTVGGFPRPQLDLSATNFQKIFDEAFGEALIPPFDPYRDGLNYMLASYVIPYMGLVGYVGTNPNLHGWKSKRLERRNEIVHPYKYTVAEFTIRISELRNRLAGCGIKDEGLIVPLELGAENMTTSNALSEDVYSISYSRTPMEILRVVYNTGDEHIPGGFYPDGANGKIARKFLQKKEL